MQKILRNRAKCLVCGDVIESTFRHHYVECSCGNIFVDGGKDYSRIGYRDGEDSYISMVEYAENRPQSRQSWR